MAKNSLANAMKEMQRLANQTQIKIQSMVNAANSAQSQYNREEAQKSRDWQETMSRSAHQMEVEDLKKAGLNPVLSTGGSGAQSYTTSSASMTPESGASALSNIASSQLGAMSNIESSRISAEAQKAAAASSAAAMKAAAQTSAAAQIYGADKSYEKAVKVAKISSEAAKWIATKKQASNPWGLLDKYLGAKGYGFDVTKKVKDAFNSIYNNPKQYFTNRGKITANNFQLNAAGQKQVDSFLRSCGMTVTNSNRKLAVQAFAFGQKNAIKNFSTLYYNAAKQHKNKSSQSSGHR